MQANTVEALALQALDLAKSAILVNLRFMSTAFARLKPLPIQNATLATDGAFLRFDPTALAQLYAREPGELTRTYLHLMMHNVFLHPFVGDQVNATCWDTACDIVVERAISELNLPAIHTSRANHQQATLALINAQLPLATAETLYRYLRDQHLSDEELAAMRAPFYADDHTPWHAPLLDEANHKHALEGRRNEEQAANHAAAPATQAAKDGTEVDLPLDANKAKPRHASARAMEEGDITQKAAPENAARSLGERFADTVNLDRSREQWKNAALEMGVQLDAYAQLWGVSGANMTMNLRAVTREKQDYREFLRKFARMGEQIRVNDDEFDYVYYTYGLSHYGNLPLIEPLEYVEEKRIRDFVIAIDTSASTKDGLVRRFIEKTYAILSHETSFFADMNVLIIQCDAAVCDVTRIAHLRDLDTYLDHLEIKGLGGTDFRPVFAFVDAALARGDLTNLGGLIYFTDGQGTFPAHKPDYNAAFVFVDETAATERVPTWAMKVLLEETVLLDEAAF